MTIDPREHESLPVHVVACGERYQALYGRLARIEKVLWAGISVAAAGFMGTIGFLAKLVADLSIS